MPKIWFEFCTKFGLKQPIVNPTWVTCRSSFIIDHTSSSFHDRVIQSERFYVTSSDYYLIYWTRNITKIKRGGHEQKNSVLSNTVLLIVKKKLRVKLILLIMKTLITLHKKWSFPLRNLRIWSHLLKKSLMENFIFCAV